MGSVMTNRLQTLADRVLADFTYRPDWYLYTWRFDDDQVWLCARYRDYDSTQIHRGHTEQLRSWPLDPRIGSESDMAYAIAHLLEGFSRHDSREFARWKGALMHDPHECSACRTGRCDW